MYNLVVDCYLVVLIYPSLQVYLNQPLGVHPQQVPIRLINAGAVGQPGSNHGSAASIDLNPIVQQMRQQQREKAEQEEELRKLREREGELPWMAV